MNNLLKPIRIFKRTFIFTWGQLKRFLLIHLGKLRIFFDAPIRHASYEDFSKKAELHMVINHDSVLSGVASLVSFYLHSKVYIEALMYIDSSVSLFDQKLIKHHIPFVRFVKYGKSENDIRHSDNLLKNTWQWQKLFTPAKSLNKQKIIIIDSDVLFLRTPTTLINWIKSGKSHLFMEDTGSYSGLSKGEFKYYLRVERISKNINTGIVGIVRPESFITRNSLNLFFKKFRKIINERLIPGYEDLYIKNSYHLLEQTAFIYLISKSPLYKFHLLDKNDYAMITYFREKSFKTMPVAMHYAGIGNKFLKNQLFIDYYNMFNL